MFLLGHCRFEERVSKNNNYALARYIEEQFRNVYHSFDWDFVLCVKKYLRHMPPLDVVDTLSDLFLNWVQ